MADFRLKSGPRLAGGSLRSGLYKARECQQSGVSPCGLSGPVIRQVTSVRRLSPPNTLIGGSAEGGGVQLM